MKYFIIFFILFIKILNILPWNNTSTNYINNYPYLYFPCYVCSLLNEYIFNNTYDVLKSFTNSPTTNIVSTTIVVPVISISQLSTNISYETVDLPKTSNSFNTLTTTLALPTSSLYSIQNTTALITIPLTTTQIVNPFLIKLNETYKKMFTSTTDLSKTSNSTIPSLINITERTIEEIIEAPVFSFQNISNLIFNIESKIASNIISNINLTDFHDIHSFITFFTSQIKQLFMDSLSTLRNETSSRNITSTCLNNII